MGSLIRVLRRLTPREKRRQVDRQADGERAGAVAGRHGAPRITLRDAVG
ncbi:hypothetical protein [Pseudomonas sp. LAIL14HWK12:I7]